jgi:hypothetical protein
VIKFVFEFDFKVYVITYTPIPVVFEKLVLTTKSIELRDVLWLGGGGSQSQRTKYSYHSYGHAPRNDPNSKISFCEELIFTIDLIYALGIQTE